MTIKSPSNITITPPTGVKIDIVIPEDLWNQIPEARKQNQEEITTYLSDSLRIGILATVNASITIDTKEMQRVIKDGMNDINNSHETARLELENLVSNKLTGSKSELAIALKDTLGKDGSLATLLQDLNTNLTDPDFNGSIPAATRSELVSAANTVKAELEQALDITDNNTGLGKFVRNQNQVVADIQELINSGFKEIKTALNVDEILAQKEDEIAELKDKSTHKGVYFENDAVEALQDIADVLGDRIEHTGGEGEGASRSKVGDIVIVIQHKGIQEQRIAIEAKAGNISRKELIRQVRSAVDNRNAVRGIGLMERRNMGKTQHILGQDDDNYIIGVDWANDDFLSLEVTYRMLRSVIIADSLKSQGVGELDVDELKKHFEQMVSDLGMMQSMKSQTRTAINTLEGVRSNMDVLEKKLKSQLEDAESFLRSE